MRSAVGNGTMYKMLAPIVIFLGSFLAFLVQPLVGNTLLPYFGGAASVWSVCLASFQTLLVAGYFYAHVLGRDRGTGNGERGLGTRVLWHIALLMIAGGGLFAVVIGGAVGVRALSVVAIAYVLLSANSSLVQVLAGGRYGLYAVSNLGSLIGLFAYPFLFELRFSLSTQWRVFAVLIAVYAVMLGALSFRRAKRPAEVCVPCSTSSGPRPALLPVFLLSFVSCYLLNAISTHLCSDVTPMPMLWVWLLALYLLSYVAAFTDRGSRLAPFAAVAVVPLSVFAVWHSGTDLDAKAFLPEFLAGSGLLFLGGWIVHSRLYRSRPDAKGLTAYYLMISLGGAAGGSFCSFVMPNVSTIIAEYPIALALALGVIALDLRDLLRKRAVEIPSRARHIVLAVLAAFVLFGLWRGSATKGWVLARYRNFYGHGRVTHRNRDLGFGLAQPINELRSGTTVHGFQKAQGDWKGQEPTCYYARHAGGLAVLSHPKYERKEPMRVALCGMGIGTLAAYAREGDFYRFYEINPAVARIAADPRFFTFLSGASGTVDVVVDDARLALERERTAGEEKYDVVVIDVFTGDSIPQHMATREAYALYLDRLADDGILAFHISNWHLDLMPLVKAVRDTFGLEAEVQFCRSSENAMYSTWAFLSRRPLCLKTVPQGNVKLDLDGARDVPMMTDEFHSLIPYLGIWD